MPDKNISKLWFGGKPSVGLKFIYIKVHIMTGLTLASYTVGFYQLPP